MDKILKINDYQVQVTLDHWELTDIPVVFVHGFLGSALEFSEIAQNLKRPSVRVNLLGFNTQQRIAPADMTMRGQVDFLAAILDALDLQRVHLVGYSMGGRVALGFAMHHPNRVARLTLESTTAGIQNVDDQVQRRETDAQRAAAIEQDYAAFIQEWTQLPLFASQRTLPMAKQRVVAQQRQRQLPSNMAESLRQMGTGAQPNYWPKLSQLTVPVTVLAGAYDEKFQVIGQKMAALLPNSHYHVIPDVGHNTHLEQPNHFLSYLL